MKQAKRIIALLLALVMVAGMLPTVFAEGNQNCLVTINYVFENGETAAASWTASLAQGSNLATTTVSNPTVPGYAAGSMTPVSGQEVTFTPEAVTLSLNNIQSDITITVTYVPAEVSYTVNHYLQNADNDLYTLEDTVVLQGLTGSQIADGLEKEYDGFYALLYDEDVEIAADGSTVVDIYYDRNYYLMTFDLGGGYGVEPVYARFGAAIGEIGTPTRPGYTFIGWDSATIPPTMPADNTTYTAQWTPVQTNYTVVFWYENADDDGYSYAGSITQTALPGTTVQSGSFSNTAFDGQDSQHFTYNSALAETQTVEGDGSTVLNVYFSRNVYMLTFRARSEWWQQYKTVATIEAKYNQSIFEEFNKAPFTTTYDGRAWEDTGNTYDYALQTLDRMPGTNVTFNLYRQSSNTLKTIYYYVQAVDSTLENPTWPDEPGNDYTLLKSVNTYFNYATYEEEYHEIEGFTRFSRSDAGFDRINQKDFSNHALDLYYLRNSYTLRFYNYDGFVDDRAVSVKYEANLGQYDFVLAYPDGLEPNAYAFAGWYLNPQCTGEQVNLADMEMPASDLVLYANWEPVSHTVNVYLDSTLVTQIGAPQTVAHGAFATAPTEFDEGQYVDYTFVGWFYMDGGVEKAFSFESMPVRQDLDIYAKWSSKVLVEYTVNFVLEGSDTPIADPITGSALAGTTRTFEAKGGTDLYELYQEGYFPRVESHSMLMSVDDSNTFTFYYVQADSVPYTVRYLERGTNTELWTEKTVEDNTHAVVTEYAKTISGYLPDAYQKRLVVTAEGENVLTFYYTKDDVHALVVTDHILVRGNVETNIQHSEITGVIGQEYSSEPLEVDGYVLDHIEVNGVEWAEEGNPSGTLTSAGLVFTFYYRYNRFDVYYQSLEDTVTYDVVENFSVTDKVNDGYLYGGLYTDDTFTTPLTAENICGLGFKPAADETYYVKEVPESYLQPKIYYVYSTYYGNALRRLYLVTALDDKNYQQVGFIVNGTDNGAWEQEVNDTNVYETVTEVRAEGQQSRTLGLSYFFNNTLETGYLNIQQYLDYSVDDMAGKTFTMQPYFVTMDGVKVTGVTLRTVDTGNGTYIPTGGTEGLHVSDAPVGSSVSVYSQPSNQMLNLMSTYTVSWDEAPAATQYTVTKVDGGSTVTQTVEPGDQTGQITYAGQSGKVFAGWFTDSACTLPADFSNVQGDMTVYAKYVDAPSTGVSVQSKRGGATTLKTTVTLDTDQFAQVGFAYDCNGDTGTAVAGEKTEKRSLMGWFFGQGNTTYQYSGSWSTGNLGFMDSFTITPYWVTLDGTTVYGEAESYLSLGALILRK